MENRIPAKQNQRTWERFIALLKAHYAVEHSTLYKECIIIDISMKGACVKLQRDKNISTGTSIFLKVLTKDQKKHTIQGEIVWIEQTENAYIAGINFKKLHNINTLKIAG
jgi:uncharacterized protein YuzE